MNASNNVAQYIGYLAGGLVSLMILFAVLYIAGTPILICLPLIGGLGALLFVTVYKYNHKYGQYGLLKKAAKKRLPACIRFHSKDIFKQLKDK